MKALVLGATGHIGAHITRALLHEGHEVRAAFRRSEYLSVLEGLSVERVHVDLESLEGLREACSGRDWVFHAAAYYPHLSSDRELAIQKGIASATAAAEVIAEAKPKRVIFTSSAATIKKQESRPAIESDVEPWPLAGWRPAYASVKIAMEHTMLQARQKDLPVIVVNPSVCIGEYDAHSFSGRVVLIFAKWQMPLAIKSAINTVYTGDVGVGHLRAAEKGIVGERYILDGQRISLLEFGRKVAAAAGRRSPLGNVPLAAVWPLAGACEVWGKLTRSEPLISRQLLDYAKGDARELDGSRAVRELGMPQTPIDEAIARTVEWFRSRGYC